MESGCQKGIVNACFCNCLDSMCISVFELILSLLGTALNSFIFAFLKKIKDKLDFAFILNYINISYFGSSSVIIIIILVLRKLQRIERAFGYKFGSYSTLIYSYFSKIMAIINIFGFLYLLGFTSVFSVRIHKDEAKDILPVTNIRLHGIIDLTTETEGVKLNCDSMECLESEKEENLPSIDYFDLFVFIFSIIFSLLFMFFNGASFSSENKRISKLITGKIEIDFIPVEKITLFDKKFCDLLNSITCYRLTVMQLLNCITILSFLSFICLLSTYIIGLVQPWPQAIFFGQNIAAPMGFVLSILSFISSIYCQGVEFCNFNEPPSKRKCIMIIILILSIFFYPLQLIGFVMIFSSQIGNASVFFDCTNEEPCDDLFTIYDNQVRQKYSFYITVNKSSGIHIFAGLILGAIPLITFFFLIVLMVSYIRRSMNEYNSLNRIYDTKIISVEENGARVDLDLIEIVSEEVKIKQSENNNEEVKEITVYSRKIRSNVVQNNY